MATEKMELPQKKISATLRNNGIARMNVERYVNWSGKPFEPFEPFEPFPSPLPSIPAGGVVKVNDLVCKGAVIYTGHNAANSPVSWVLAWDAPEVVMPGARDAPEVTMPGARNKVYVTCGSKSDIDKLTWEEIRKMLERSSDKSTATDPISKTTVDAQIKVNIISVPPGAAVALDANFGILI